jgi:hypothetical protein
VPSADTVPVPVLVPLPVELVPALPVVAPWDVAASLEASASAAPSVAPPHALDVAIHTAAPSVRIEPMLSRVSVPAATHARWRAKPAVVCPGSPRTGAVAGAC